VVAHAAVAVTLVGAAALVWPPAARSPGIPLSQARGVEELSAIIGEPAPQPEAVEKNVREWTRFPPAGADGRGLAVAMAGCPMEAVPASTRIDLARRLYVITDGFHVSDDDLAQTADAFQRAAALARCGSDAARALVDAVRWTARHDPRPRADWW
jgi:hypothetical protein